jgi:hypothetical protein
MSLSLFTLIFKPALTLLRNLMPFLLAFLKLTTISLYPYKTFFVFFFTAFIMLLKLNYSTLTEYFHWCPVLLTVKVDFLVKLVSLSQLDPCQDLNIEVF